MKVTGGVLVLCVQLVTGMITTAIVDGMRVMDYQHIGAAVQTIDGSRLFISIIGGR